MPLLDDAIREEVRTMLTGLMEPVRVVVFTQPFQCQYCAETRQLVEEVAALSDKIAVEVYDLSQDREEAMALGVDKAPAIVPMRADGTDYGVRFFGIPSGYEFGSLLDAILTVSAGRVDLMPETMAFLEALPEPLHLQVFVTPTCPYCPRAVVLAHHLAVASPKVRADMVESLEFPELADRYHVYGVPRTVIDEAGQYFLEGAAPEWMLVARMQEAVGMPVTVNADAHRHP
ncbi:MAG TPA: glutaredoxin [Chloroflexi bacterium]|nr:glutaredoxin [Chloroflexota bacterium]